MGIGVSSEATLANRNPISLVGFYKARPLVVQPSTRLATVPESGVNPPEQVRCLICFVKLVSPTE
jgi:hypothetical protein